MIWMLDNHSESQTFSRKSLKWACWIILCLLPGGFFWPGLQAQINYVQNGEFNSGISGWQFQGNVTVVNGEAVLSDGGSDYSHLYQMVLIPEGNYQIDFDFSNQLSDNVPDFTAPDTVFASLYFAQNLAVFDLLNGIFSTGRSLFDLDHSGIYNSNGSVTPSQKGPGWLHFSATFQTRDNATIPVFELFADNLITGDSLIRIDNVTIFGLQTDGEPVRIPTLSEAGIWILLIGLVLLGLVQLVKGGLL
jgi:hypothetical protein